MCDLCNDFSLLVNVKVRFCLTLKISSAHVVQKLVFNSTVRNADTLGI